MCLNHPFSFGAMFSRKNEGEHVFKARPSSRPCLNV